MHKNKGFIGIGLVLAIILGIAVVGGGAYYLGISKGENKKTVEISDIENQFKNELDNQNKIKEKEYINNKYGFKFNYPESWIVSEGSFEEFNKRMEGILSYEGLTISITDPSFSKEVYDCCYTKEEIEKYGTKPSLNIEIIKSISHKNPLTKYEEWGTKTRAIYDKLIKDYPESILKTILSFVPTLKGQPVNTEGLDMEFINARNSCSNVELVSVNNNDVVKFTDCPEDAPDLYSAGALYIRKDSLIIKIKDETSKYLKRGDFDRILKSFKFTN